MIDLVYKVLLTLLNKENRGYLSPSEFNLLAKLVQDEIYNEYFTEYKKAYNRKNKGLVGVGYGNTVKTLGEKLSKFFTSKLITINSGEGVLPNDLVFIEKYGVKSTKANAFTGKVLDELVGVSVNHLLNSEVKPTEIYPVFSLIDNKIKVYPDTITEVEMRYLRKAKTPSWTYSTVNGSPMFNPSSSTYQDFELNQSEFDNICIRMASYLGITLREADIVNLTQQIKNTEKINENSN